MDWIRILQRGIQLQKPAAMFIAIVMEGQHIVVQTEQILGAQPLDLRLRLMLQHQVGQLAQSHFVLLAMVELEI